MSEQKQDTSDVRERLARVETQMIALANQIDHIKTQVDHMYMAWKLPWWWWVLIVIGVLSMAVFTLSDPTENLGALFDMIMSFGGGSSQ